MKNHNLEDGSETGSRPRSVAQATVRPRSELECERVITLAHGSGIASATAYRGPESETDDGASPIFIMLVDEADEVERFLPELRGLVPDIPVSVVREEIEHVSPADFLRNGLGRKRFGVASRHLAWIFVGGSLGAGARIATESAASYLTTFHDAFPWGTMVANVVGSFVIAIFGAMLFERFVGERERMFWVLGFLGSLTTFSSYTDQTSQVWAESPVLGSLYGGGSIVLGLLAALSGLWLTRRWIRWS